MKTHVEGSVVDLVGSISNVSKNGVGRLDEINLKKKRGGRVNFWSSVVRSWMSLI